MARRAERAVVALQQAEAMRAWENEGDFRAAIDSHPEVTALLKPEAIARAFSLERQLGHVDAIFERVFAQQDIP